MKIEERRVRTARIELDGGREVRLVRWSGVDGGHVTVYLSWPEALLDGQREDSIRLPADALPELTETLEALAGGMTTNPTDDRAEVSGG